LIRACDGASMRMLCVQCVHKSLRQACACMCVCIYICIYIHTHTIDPHVWRDDASMCMMCVQCVHKSIYIQRILTCHDASVCMTCVWCVYVSFAEYSLFYRAILQKRPIVLRSLLMMCVWCVYDVHRGGCGWLVQRCGPTNYYHQSPFRYCNTLQHTAAHCNTLQNTEKMTWTIIISPPFSVLQHTATHCNTLQHAVAH